MVVGCEACEVRIGEYKKETLICKSMHTIGNGAYKDIYDIIYVDPETFDISKSNSFATQIGELTRK